MYLLPMWRDYFTWLKRQMSENMHIFILYDLREFTWLVYLFRLTCVWPKIMKNKMWNNLYIFLINYDKVFNIKIKCKLKLTHLQQHANSLRMNRIVYTIEVLRIPGSHIFSASNFSQDSTKSSYIVIYVYFDFCWHAAVICLRRKEFHLRNFSRFKTFFLRLFADWMQFMQLLKIWKNYELLIELSACEKKRGKQ